MRSSISSFSAVAAVTLLLIATAYGIAAVQAGYPVPGEKTEPWFGNVARMREILYAQRTDPNKPTIWIVAGSNALYGTASDVIAERTGYNVKNYALHGGLHIDLMFSQIRGKVRKGDIVLAPLEWENRDRPFGNQFDYTNYLHHFSRSVNLSPWTTYQLYTSVPLKHWWNGLVAYIGRPKNTQSYWEDYSAAALREDWELRRRPGKENYTHRALTPAGDIQPSAQHSYSGPQQAATFVHDPAGTQTHWPRSDGPLACLFRKCRRQTCRDIACHDRSARRLHLHDPGLEKPGAYSRTDGGHLKSPRMRPGQGDLFNLLPARHIIPFDRARRAVAEQ